MPGIRASRGLALHVPKQYLDALPKPVRGPAQPQVDDENVFSDYIWLGSNLTDQFSKVKDVPCMLCGLLRGPRLWREVV